MFGTSRFVLMDKDTLKGLVSGFIGAITFNAYERQFIYKRQEDLIAKQEAVIKQLEQRLNKSWFL